MLLWQQDCHLPWSPAHCHTSNCNNCRTPSSAPSSSLSAQYLVSLPARGRGPVACYPLSYSPVVWCQSLGCVRLFATPWTVARQGLSAHGILQARILEWVAISISRGSSQPGSPAWWADSLPSEPPEKSTCHLSHHQILLISPPEFGWDSQMSTVSTMAHTSFIRSSHWPTSHPSLIQTLSSLEPVSGWGFESMNSSTPIHPLVNFHSTLNQMLA